jgi:electron transfer flavoprotein beta subunit
MNVVVCVKQVLDTETRIKLHEGKSGVVRDNVKFIMSPFDEFALEEAVRLKEKHGGTVTAVSLGPERAKDVLRTCLAIGADKAVHVNDGGLLGTDSLGVARALTAAIRKLDHDLVLFGKKAVGVDRGHVPAQVAQMLGYPFVSNVFNTEVGEGKVTVEREIEGGVEKFEVTLPAVLSREKNANELRHAPLKGIMMAKSKPIQGFTLADLGLAPELLQPKLRVAGMEYPPQRTAGRVISGEPAEAVRELVRLLREEAKVI